MSIFDGYKHKDNRETQRKMMQFQVQLKSRLHQTQYDACLEYNHYLKKCYKNPLTLKSQYSKARNLINKYLLDNRVSVKQVNRCRSVFVLPIETLKEIKQRYNQNVITKNKTQVVVTVNEMQQNIEWASTTLQEKGSHYLFKMIAIAVVTGRRFYEIGCKAKFEREANNDKQLLFTGQAKTRKNEAHESFFIRCLTLPDTVVNALSCLRHAKPDMVTLDYIGFNNRLSRQINDKLTEAKLHGIKQPKDTRNLYLAYCLEKFKPRGISNNAYAASVLGHGEMDITTCNSYMTHCVIE